MPDALRGALAGCRVLVTGARGFLGSHLVQRLARAGAELHCVSRAPRAEAAGVRWWQADPVDPAEAERLIRSAAPDVVFHLGGHVTASPTIDQVRPAFESLLASTVWMLLAAANVGVRRFVLIGSASEVDAADAAPASPYLAAKQAASAYGRLFQAAYGVPVVIARPVIAFGPGQSDEKLIPSVAAQLLAGRAPRLGAGRLAADWIYIDDLIEALVRIAHVPGIEGQTIALGTGVLTSVREVVERLFAIVREHAPDCPEPIFGALPDRPSEVYPLPDPAVALKLLDWKASTSLDQGLRRTVDWIATRGAA